MKRRNHYATLCYTVKPYGIFWNPTITIVQSRYYTSLYWYWAYECKVAIILACIDTGLMSARLLWCRAHQCRLITSAYFETIFLLINECVLRAGSMCIHTYIESWLLCAYTRISRADSICMHTYIKSWLYVHTYVYRGRTLYAHISAQFLAFKMCLFALWLCVCALLKAQHPSSRRLC